MLGCLAVALALAAEPQCPTEPRACRVQYGGRLDWQDQRYACNTTNWMIVDYCNKLCPMRLVITDPPELRTWMCAIDNSFEPYAPDAHIDLHHPLNNQVLEVEAVGHPGVGSTRRGCDTAAYAWGNKTVAGKIALVRRGGCNFDTKALQAHAAQAAMLFVVDYWPYYTWRTVAGSTAGIETFPSFFAARHEADYVLAALDRGVKVKGKFQYQCNDMPEGYLDNPQDYPWDRCGDSVNALYDTCLKEGAPEPLCEVCTVELQLPDAEKLCLFGNELRPRKKETLMHTSWDMPYTAQQDEVVYATELANRGCSVSDYAGLAGKILLVPETGRCTLVMTVRSAQAAGVKAYILVTSTWYLQWYHIRAYSHHVHIPVHTVDYHATPKLQAFVANGGGRHIPGSGYALDAIKFTHGVPPPTEAPTPVPLPLVPPVDTSPKLDTSPDFELSAGTAICIAVICIDVAVLGVLFVRQRRDAVQLPAEVRVKTFSIPLKVASMGLSLTLLVLTAIVTFSLTRVAGQESTDKAMDNGRAAVGLAYDSSEKNTVDLSDTIRSNVIDRVLVLLQKEIFNMEYKLKVVQDLFFGFNGSWSEFDARSLTFMRLQRNADASSEAVQMQLFTTRGFYMNMNHKTDDRPDEQRKDGVIGNVAETQEGWRYGVNMLAENYITREFEYARTVPPYHYNASRMLAGNVGDPLAVTANQPLGHSTWIASRLTFPLRIHDSHPMSAYRPLYGGEGQYHGTIEVMAELSEFIGNALQPSVQSSALTSAVALSAGIMQNMTVVVVDVADKAIFGAHNIGTRSSKIEGYVKVGIIVPFHGLYYMHSHPSIKVTALANYFDSVEGWTEHEGVFDQKDYFSEQPFLTLAKITASGGRAADTGVHNWDVEMRDGACGACVAYDAQLQKEVLVFDGATTLHIYRNMTRRTPVVAQSQVSKPGEPWRSRYEAFADTLTHADGTEWGCVANTWRTTATESEKRCLLRPDISAESSYTVSMRIRPDVAYTETSPRATTPRLFSDSLVGDANIRLFANGQLYLFVLRYGCRTKAYKGGFPVHVWTTVTAVVGMRACRVYVNGTLSDSGFDSRDPVDTGVSFYRFHAYDVRIHANPYRTGQFFKGRIDSVHLFRYAMDGQDAASLHGRDRLVRDVPRKRFFAQTKTLDMNDEQRAGVAWSVAVMIPRDDIMRVVDANRRKTLAEVQTQEDNTNKELVQKANWAIMVIVAIAMTSVVVFLIFNNVLTQPFAKFAHEIMRVSQADVEGIAMLEGDVSLLQEINVMRRAINTLVVNMREYKTFMPEAIFSNEPVFSETHAQVPPGLDTGHAAVLFTDVKGSTQLWEECTEEMAEALRLHNTVIREVMADHDGYEVKTIGDAFMISFTDLQTAVAFGLRAQERLLHAAWPAGLLEAVYVPGDEARGLRGLPVRMGVTYGAVNVECNEIFRRCDYFGPTVNRAARLEANGVCGGVAVEASAVADIAAVLQGDAITVQLGTRSLKGIGDVPLCLLVPKGMPQRAAYAVSVHPEQNPLNALVRVSSGCSSTGSAGSAHSLSRSVLRQRLQAVERFKEQLSEVGSATTGYIDFRAQDTRAVEVTALAEGNLRMVVAGLGRCDGRLLNVCGTAALVAWNVMAPCAGHLEAALRFAPLAAGKGTGGTGAHCGLCSGKVFTGYLGAGKQRFVTAVGQCVQVCQFAYFRAVQAEQAVMFAAQDARATAAMQARGLATAAENLRQGDTVYSVCTVLCDVVSARLEESKHALLSTAAARSPLAGLPSERADASVL